MNKVILIGNLGKDPETRSLSSGDRVCSFRMATGERWTDKQTGEKRERTEWHTVVIFNQGLANVAEQYLRKGSKCMVEGQLQTRKWQDQQGTDRYSTEIVLRQYNGALELLSSKEERDRSDEAVDRGREIAEREHQRQAENRAPPPSGKGNGYHPDLDDDIPF